MTPEYSIFFRNDDVDVIQPGLQELTNIFLDRGIPLNHAVVPFRLSGDVASWLSDLSASRIEVIQHGFTHAIHDKGEFGGKRSFEEQWEEMHRGKQILEEKFGNQFFPAFSFPYGHYNSYSITALDRLGYKAVSSFLGLKTKRRIFNQIGHLLHIGRLAGRHISYHTLRIPRTNMLELSVAISATNQYVGGYTSTNCGYESLESLKTKFDSYKRYTPIIGIVLHHRYHGEAARLELVSQFVDWLYRMDNVRFYTLGEIYYRLVGMKTRE
jgi:hypothetical protein